MAKVQFTIRNLYGATSNPDNISLNSESNLKSLENEPPRKLGADDIKIVCILQTKIDVFHCFLHKFSKIEVETLT